MRPAIRVEQISKQFRLGVGPAKGNNLTENLRLQARNAWDKVVRLARPNAAPPDAESFWALRDVSFDVQPGEVVGIIGRNGAGKSTLLKILSQIVEPTSGHAEVRGRMGSLLEVGTGFHPELTGRENVYLNGAILGMTRREIGRKFDEIVAFSDVERFLDTPVKRYSSGMQVRLAFAVAAHLEPEILVVDEVLAVGDATFQQKCLGKMSEARGSGRTVLIVSHQTALIQQLCTSALWLVDGRVRQFGKSRDVVNAYLGSVDSAPEAVVALTTHRGRRPGSERMMREVAFFSRGEKTSAIRIGDELEIRLAFAAGRALNKPSLGIIVKDSFGQMLTVVNNKFLPSEGCEGPAADGEIRCLFDSMPLLPGRYSLDLHFGDALRDHDVIHDAATFEVTDWDYFGTGKLPPSGLGSIAMKPRWLVCEHQSN